MDPTDVLRIKSEDEELIHYPAVYEELPEEYRLYAKNELNETEENRNNGLQRLKDYMERENLRCPDDNYLLCLLRSSKYNFSKIKGKLKKCVKARQMIVSRLSQMEMATIEKIIDEGSQTNSVLPYRDRLGRLIVYTRPSLDLEKHNIDEVFVCGLVSMFFFMSFPMSSVSGYVYFGDCKDPSVHTFYNFTKVCKKFASVLVGMPFRLCRIDVLNEHFLARWCIYVLRSLFPEKLYRRVSMHGSDLKKIHKLFHPDILPYDLEGNLGPLSNKHYRDKLLKFIENLRKEKA